MSVKGRALRWLGAWVLREARVAEVASCGALRFVRLAGELPDLAPGDKLQLLVGDADVRTWSPIAVPGGAALLLHDRGGEAPGARWVRGVAPGEVVRFVGPSRSLRPPDGPLVVVADETALAMAASFARARDARVIAAVAPGAEVADGLARVGVAARVLAGATADASAEAALAEGAGRHPVVAGGSALVAAVRDALRARGSPPPTLKTYWIPGREGLD